METIPFFRALLFTRCVLYSIYRIINEKFKTRAIEPYKIEVLTFVPFVRYALEKRCYQTTGRFVCFV